MKKQTLFLLGAICASTLWAQKKNEAYQYFIHPASSPIEVDGQLDESAWSTAMVATDFFMVQPMDTSKAQLRTEVRMSYDERFLYLSAVNYQDPPIMVESLRRDWNFVKNDNFIFFLDPFDDQTNGFTFGANAAGAEWDGQQFEGAAVNLNWDNRWFSKVRQYPDRWIFEAAIPFKSIRYKEGISRWGINFSRNDLTSTEKSAWAPVPRQLPTASLAYTGVLVWDTPPRKAGQNISIIPFMLGGTNRQFQPEGAPTERLAFGGDAKVAITSSLNLDLTVNPDFSQVEVDRQQTNLDRFELFFPERRQFFLENSDLFNNLGLSNVRPFFSRRIGLNAPIYAGTRLSGKLNKDWRIGLMNMETGETETPQGTISGQNFGVLAVQRRVFSRSNVTAFMINKQRTRFDAAEHINAGDPFNRNIGIEYNLASKNDVWRGKFLHFNTLDPEKPTDAFASAASISYNNRRLSYSLTQEYVGDNYNPEVGFTPRRGYHKTTVSGGYNFFPKAGPILSYRPGFSNFIFASQFGNSVENETAIFHDFTFRNRAVFTFWKANNYLKLLAPFDPTNLTGIKLPAGSEHIWNSFGTVFESRPQRLINYGWSTRYGGYFASGTRLRVAGNISYRLQPYASLAVSAEYNEIKFPKNGPFELKNAYFWLVGPRLDLTFTNKIYLTTFVQYNQQTDNINFNARFQWRYAPVSDLYLVFTDNYLPEQFAIKNRAFVLKFTYWWNV
jgi:hypothetical protein